MSGFAVFLIYAVMSAFDAFVLGGTVYLIGWHGWSGWWMLFAFLMCAGSNPRRLIEAVTGNKTE